MTRATHLLHDLHDRSDDRVAVFGDRPTGRNLNFTKHKEPLVLAFISFQTLAAPPVPLFNQFAQKVLQRKTCAIPTSIWLMRNVRNLRPNKLIKLCSTHQITCSILPQSKQIQQNVEQKKRRNKVRFSNKLDVRVDERWPMGKVWKEKREIIIIKKDEKNTGEKQKTNN